MNGYKRNIPVPTVTDLEYLRLGLGLVGVGVSDKKTLALIWIVMKQVEQLGGDFSLHDAVDIEILVTKKFKPKKVTLKDKKDESETKVAPDTTGNTSDHNTTAAAV